MTGNAIGRILVSITAAVQKASVAASQHRPTNADCLSESLSRPPQTVALCSTRPGSPMHQAAAEPMRAGYPQRPPDCEVPLPAGYLGGF